MVGTLLAYLHRATEQRILTRQNRSVTDRINVIALSRYQKVVLTAMSDADRQELGMEFMAAVPDMEAIKDLSPEDGRIVCRRGHERGCSCDDGQTDGE